MTSFNSFGFPETIAQALTTLNFETATPIQAKAIPVALKGKDILGTAQTGTGKTAAFGLPLLTHLVNNPDSVGLILCPTRELATQVMNSMRDFMKFTSGIRSALLLGGNPMPMQLDQLKRRPRLIIGTPGRVNDHLRRNKHMLAHADFVVLDEADRMLDMGFTPQLDAILEHVPEKRQNLMFSATMDKRTEKFTSQYLNEPVRIAVEAKKITADNINHSLMHTTAQHKYEALLKEINERSGSIIIFVKTRRNADKIASDLCRQGHEAEPIHGDLRQRQRDRAIRGFRDMKYRIMVATDVAARGLDIPHIEHVINYDLPQCPEDYVHRIGRTARAGAKGNAVSFICPSDRGKWSAINHLINPNDAVNDDRERFSRSHTRNGNSNGRKAASFQNRKKSSRDSFQSNRFEDRKPFGEKRSSFGDDNRRSDDRRSSFGGEKRPRFDDNRGSDDRRSSFGGEKRPRFDDNGRSDDRRSSFGGEKRSRFDDNKRSDDRRSSFGGEKRPRFGDDNRRSDDRRSSFGGEKRPRFNDNRDSSSATPFNRRPQRDEARASVENDNGTFRLKPKKNATSGAEPLKKKKKIVSKKKDFKFKAHARNGK